MAEVVAFEGREGWLFLDGDSNSVIQQIKGQRLVDPEGLKRWNDEIAQRSEALHALTIPQVFVVAPNKETIYADYLPSELRRANVCPVDQILRLFQDNCVPYIYPLAELHQARAVADPYSPIETHWNDYGALIAANCILSQNGIPQIPLCCCEFKTETWSGDLGSKMNPVRKGPWLRGWKKPRAEARLLYDNRMTHGGHVLIYGTSYNSKKVLIFGDSFANNLTYWLAEGFGSAIFVHSTAFDLELIKSERPDLVVWESVERFLVLPPARMIGFTVEDIFKKKLSTLTQSELEEQIAAAKVFLQSSGSSFEYEFVRQYIRAGEFSRKS
jgi:SGNH hydrolase-like domain, acetyltransferase AlgX